MFRRKFIRLGSALLMILALTLPVATVNVPSALAVTAVTSVAPTSGSDAGATPVVITGTGFLPGICDPATADAATTVTFDIGGTPAVATLVDVTSGTTLSAVTAAHPAGGPVTITVAQSGPCAGVATSATSGPLYTYTAPVSPVTSVTPNTGPDEGGNTVTVNGTGFSAVTSVAFCTDSAPALGSCASAVPTGQTATTITVVVPAAPTLGLVLGAQNIEVTVTGTTGSGTCTNCYGYFELTATGISPSSGGPGTVVTITGTGFNPTSTVSFGGTPGTGVTVNAAGTSLTVTAPSGPSGTVLVTVSGGGETSAGLPFTYTTVATGTAVGTPVGAVSVSGTVVGTSPAGVRPNVHVVLINQVSGAFFSTHTGATGTWTITGVPQGSYRLSLADNDDETPAGSSTDCAPTAGVACGHLINQSVIAVGAGGASTGTITLSPIPVPGALPSTVPVTTVGFFGEARDATTGSPISGAAVTVVQGATTRTVTTGADGRWSVADAAYVATTATTATLIPITGTCAPAGFVEPNTGHGLCADTLNATLPNVAPSAGWNNAGAFLVVGAVALATPSANALGTGVLQGIIPMIFRDTDTSRTGGVDIETETIRVLNGGIQRTVACVDFFGSDADGRRTTQQRQCLDLNPQAAGLFSGDIVPSGLMGFAEVYSVDLDGSPTGPCVGTTLAGTATPTPTTGGAVATGCVYGVSDLHSVITHRVADADNAVSGTNGLTCEDVMGTVANCGSNVAGIGQQTTLSINQNMVLPVVLKNFGGTPDKWDTVVHACQASGVPVTQPVVFEFWSVNAPGSPGYSNPFLYNRTADPGGCITFNLRDLDFLDNGPYAVNVTSTGLVGPPISSGLARPNTFTLASVMYSRTGRAATAHNGYAPATGGSVVGQCTAATSPGFTGLCSSKFYGPLIFADYNTGGGSWWSGIAIGNFPATGTGGSTAVTLTIIDEAGVTRGVINDRPGGDSTTVFWLGVQPGTDNRGVWLRGRLVVPLDRNFRGSFIADAADVTGTLASSGGGSSRRPFAMVHHTNYARKAFISYNSIREEAINPTQFGLPAQAADSRVCSMQINSQLNVPPGPGNPAPTGSTCLWAPEVIGAVPQNVRLGQATGIRFFNPSGNVETVDVVYFDAAGIEWADSRTSFSIGPFSTATIFTGTDFRLPPNFSGSVYIMATCAQAGAVNCTAPVAAIANIVDYSVTTRDGSRAYNLPSQSGFTQ